MDRYIDNITSFVSVEVILFFGFLFLIFWLMTSKPQNYPPGPPKWPIFGNLFQMKSNGKLYLGMNKLYKQYGEVAGIFLGNTPLVLISGYDAIREATIRDDLSGRPKNVFQEIVNKGPTYGFGSINGEVWKAQRRFTLHHLRNLGFGKRTLEGIAHEEIQAVFKDIDSLSRGPNGDCEKPVCFQDVLGGASINVLWHITTGQRYEHNDTKFKNLITCVRNFLQSTDSSSGIVVAFPIIGKVFPSFTSVKAKQVARNAMQNFVQTEIDIHKKSVDFENPRDFIDIYLSEMEKQKSDPESSFHEMQLQQICMDLFLAGTDTTFNSILYALLCMIVYPDIQKKIQEDLDKVVGKDRLPSLEDRAKLSYLEATIKEVMRLNSLVPLSVVHAPFTEKDEVSFRGYKIPKNSRVLLNLYDLHHDQKIWDEPHKFKPERFLDGSGKVINHEALMPFGAGKRSCLGESLARNNFFLFFSAIMQRYYLSVPDGHPTPSAEPIGSVVLLPRCFEAKVQLRN